MPKLRFPEFLHLGAWEETPLKRVLSPIVRERPKPSEPYTGLGLRSHGKGTFLKEQEDPAKNAMDVLFEVRRDDLIVNITFAWEGAIAIAGSSDDGALVSHRFPTYTFEKGQVLPDFFRYVILEKQFVYSLGVISPGGAGRNRVMSKTDFLKLRVLHPERGEQQKIADCLVSVDTLIEAQERKVAALKAHKKGLMQQLFPQEGETQPRLRFPEFRDAAPWNSDSLGNLFDISSGGTPERTNVDYWNGRIPWITTSLVHFNIITDVAEYITDAGLRNSSAKIFPEQTILMAMYGQGKTRGQVAMLGVKAATNQACAAILPRMDIDSHFVFLHLGSRYEELRGLSNSGGQENLSQGLIKGLQFAFPVDPAEQQRIAHCFTSLNDLIAAEAKKLDKLKTHKKGLMQQLFPTAEEADV